MKVGDSEGLESQKKILFWTIIVSKQYYNNCQRSFILSSAITISLWKLLVATGAASK